MNEQSGGPTSSGHPFTITPNEILYSDLSDRSVRLYNYIMNLSNAKGYCFASNKYLADLLKVSESSMKSALKELIENGFVSSVIMLKPNGDYDYRALTPTITQFRSTKAVETKSKVSAEDSMDFLEFWGMYPKKVNKKQTKEIFMTLSQSTRADVISAAALYNEAIKTWPKSDMQYIPSPHNWLANERYTDDPKEWKKSTVNSKDVYIQTNKKYSTDL